MTSSLPACAASLLFPTFEAAAFRPPEICPTPFFCLSKRYNGSRSTK